MTEYLERIMTEYFIERFPQTHPNRYDPSGHRSKSNAPEGGLLLFAWLAL